MQTILVVGAGLAGLASAQELAGHADVTVIDRLPAVGGTTGWNHPVVAGLERACCASGVHFLLGATALRWTGTRLLVAAPGEIQWLAGDALVCATGSRPSTMSESRLLGNRLAGVVSATVAKHLLEAGVQLGKRPVVVGTGNWAEAIAESLHKQGVPVSAISREVEDKPTYADEWWPGWRPESVRGHGRVEQLTVIRDSQRTRILCDAVILADGLRPLRNIEGAVFGGERVTFIQDVAPRATAEEVVAGAREAARQMLSGAGRSVE